MKEMSSFFALRNSISSRDLMLQLIGREHPHAELKIIYICIYENEKGAFLDMKDFFIYMKFALFSSQYMYVEKYEAPIAILFGVKNQIDCSLFGEFWGDHFSDITV